MKPVLLSLVFALLLPLISVSQPVQGSKEISLQGYVTSRDISVKEKGSSSSDSYSDDMTIGSLYLRMGYFITDNFSIDPELNWGFTDQTSPAFAFSLNGSFHAPLKENLFVFVTGGAGLSNSVPFFNVAVDRYTEKFDITMYNFGGGIKYYLTENLALRTEFRYQIYNFEEKEEAWGPYPGYTLETTIKNSSLLVGFSVLL